MTAANDIVNDDAWIYLALIDVLPKHALATFLLGPVDLFGIKRVTHTESYRNASGTGTDDGNLRQLTGNVTLDAKLPAQRDGQNARGVVISKRERHLK